MSGLKHTLPSFATAGAYPAIIKSGSMRLYLIALALALFTLYQGVRAVDRALHPEAWADRAAPAISRVHQF